MKRETFSRIIAIDPRARGIGYVVIEDRPLQLLDWGLLNCKRGLGNGCLKRLDRLVGRYEPSVVVFEDLQGAPSQRVEALQSFYESFVNFLHHNDLDYRAYRRGVMRDLFSGAGVTCKRDIAEVLAFRFTELKSYLPPERGFWKSEHPRMTIFDALSFAITHIHIEDVESSSSSRRRSSN